jgi:molybdate transport system substrate-binding protein
MRKRVMATACVLVFGTAAQAAEIRVLASNGIKEAVQALGAQFQKTSGDTLSADFSTSATVKERIEKGEQFDVAIVTDDVIDALIKSGALVSSTRTGLARAGIGVGFRKGAAKPDVRTTASLKDALLGAKSIAFTGNGASRPYIDKMFAGLGIAREMAAKAHLVGPGAGPASVAKGESDIAITLISEILPVEGVVVAGPLPSEFQSYLGFSAAIGAKSAKAPAARALIKFLDAPAAAVTYKAKGMEAH